MSKEVGSFRKAWNFVWNDESLLGWLISLILIFLVIKFIFFPLLSLTLGTYLPLVVVESESMSHDAFVFGEFDSWWEDNHGWYETFGISRDEARVWSLKSGLQKGDIAVILGYRGNDKPKVGDVIVFEAGQRHPIIHRVISIEMIDGELFFDTKGDGNSQQISLDKKIPEDAVIGRAIVKVPKVGYIKLFFVEIMNAF